MQEGVVERPLRVMTDFKIRFQDWIYGQQMDSGSITFSKCHNGHLNVVFNAITFDKFN